MAFSETIRQTGYVVKETTFGTIPTFSNSNAFRFINLTAEPSFANIERPDKTGTYSRTAPIPDNKGGSWAMSCSLAGNGAAGTAPDIGPFLEALLGKVTVNASTSVIYDPDDVNPTLSIMLRDKPTTVDQLIAKGCIVQQARFQLGPAIPTVEFSGLAQWVLSKDLFASNDTEGKGGLAAFPSEPAAPVTNGVPPRGRTGTITLDGNTYTTFRRADITVATARALSEPAWGSAYPSAPESGARTVSVGTLELYDDDSVNLAALKGKALSKTAVDLSFTIGTTAGNIWTFLLKNCVLPMPTYGWGETRRTVVFSNIQAAATSATSKDETKITLT